MVLTVLNAVAAAAAAAYVRVLFFIAFRSIRQICANDDADTVTPRQRVMEMYREIEWVELNQWRNGVRSSDSVIPKQLQREREHRSELAKVLISVVCIFLHVTFSFWAGIH